MRSQIPGKFSHYENVETRYIASPMIYRVSYDISRLPRLFHQGSFAPNIFKIRSTFSKSPITRRIGNG